MRFIRTLILFFVSLFFLQGCGCGSHTCSLRGVSRIGVDPTWYPIDFGPQVSYVNGYVEDLLLQIALDGGIQFERMPASWDNLFEGLKEGKYDAVLTSLPPYEYNLAKYDFSEKFLELGPVLILPIDAQETSLSKMAGERVGIITGDPAVLVLQKHPDIILRNYNSIPDLLNAVSNGQIEAALFNSIPAVNYVGDLYAGKLKIASGPMTDEGLRLVSLKGKQTALTKSFNQSLHTLKKKKKFSPLLEKWNLSVKQ